MKNVLIWIFCIVFSFSAIRVTLNISSYPDYLLPDSSTEIPYDSEGERLSFYEYYQIRKSYNTNDYLPLRSFLQVLSSFEAYEFHSYQNLKNMAEEITTLVDHLTDLESDNVFETIFQVVGGIFSITYVIGVYSFLGIGPVIIDVVSLILVVFEICFNLLGIAF